MSAVVQRAGREVTSGVQAAISNLRVDFCENIASTTVSSFAPRLRHLQLYVCRLPQYSGDR